jgi:phage terminase large subunit-like protein
MQKPRFRPAKFETDADWVIGWIQKHCRIPEGKDVGKEVVLRQFQRDAIVRIYNNPAGTRRAIISFGRKNAKTTLVAFLLLVHLCGPKALANSQLFSAAQSRDQAALIFSLAAKIVRMSPTLCHSVTIRDTAKQLFCPGLGTLYRALSAEATTAFGLSPVFIVHDELGQVHGPRSPLYEALETATGAQEEPLSIIISTQAPTDADLLSMLIDDALAANDPRTVVSLYTAPLEDDPFDRATVAKANPAIGDFLNETEVMAMAEDARRMPAREAEYRNLILNQRVESVNPFVTRSVWQACGGEVGDLATGLPIYAGLDLSSVDDLTAFVMIGRINSVWHIKPTFWLPAEGLRVKAKKDRVPYDKWAEQGFLQTTPGNTVSYKFVAEYLFDMFKRYNIMKLGFDRWNMKHLNPWLLEAGFSETMIKDRFVDFGQGTQSMSPALRDLESALLDHQLAHANHPVLAMCAACAVVDGKDDANRKLSKNKSTGRIDGLVALTMAMGVAPLRVKAFDISAMIA